MNDRPLLRLRKEEDEDAEKEAVPSDAEKSAAVSGAEDNDEDGIYFEPVEMDGKKYYVSPVNVGVVGVVFLHCIFVRCVVKLPFSTS